MIYRLLNLALCAKLHWEVHSASGELLAASKTITQTNTKDGILGELGDINLPPNIRKIHLFARCKKHGLSEDYYEIEVP